MGELRNSRQNIAIVIDEHGATAGLVTIDDAIASILGGIHDEYDKGTERPLERVRILSPGHIRVPGNLRLDDINALLRTSLDSRYYETLGGFLMEQLERLPVRNDSWSSGAVRMRVVEMAGRTVQTVDIFLDSGDKA
jgi:CBS domain containing-hemolysin-like protein